MHSHPGNILVMWDYFVAFVVFSAVLLTSELMKKIQALETNQDLKKLEEELSRVVRLSAKRETYFKQSIATLEKRLGNVGKELGRSRQRATQKISELEQNQKDMGKAHDAETKGLHSKIATLVAARDDLWGKLKEKVHMLETNRELQNLEEKLSTVVQLPTKRETQLKQTIVQQEQRLKMLRSTIALLEADKASWKDSQNGLLGVLHSEEQAKKRWAKKVYELERHQNEIEEAHKTETEALRSKIATLEEAHKAQTQGLVSKIAALERNRKDTEVVHEARVQQVSSEIARLEKELGLFSNMDGPETELTDSFTEVGVEKEEEEEENDDFVHINRCHHLS
jgi:DNA repair exonuclease SbcCD ATPase subunit